MILSLLLVSALTAQEGAPAGTITGTVRDQSGAAIAAASVRVECGGTVARTRTDAAGTFAVASLPTGSCAVSAESDLFAPASLAFQHPSSGPVVLTLAVRSFATTVTVTASRGVREDALEIPQMTSVMTRRELDSRPFQLLPQALREEPGILLQQTTTAQSSPIIRGFTGQSNVYLIDNVRFNTASWRSGPSQYLSWIDSAIASRIEIVRGPGSVAYGSDALGGVVNVRTEQPALTGMGMQTSGKLQLGFGSADRSASGIGHVTLQSRHGAFRIGGSRTSIGDLRAGRGVDSHAAVTRFLGLPSGTIGTRMPRTGFVQSGGFLTGSIRAGAEATLNVTYLHQAQSGASRYDRIEGGDGLFRSGFEPQRLDFGVVRYQRTTVAGLDDLSVSFSLNRQEDGRFEQTRPSAVVDRQNAITTVYGTQVEGQRRLGTRQTVSAGAEMYREGVDAWREQVSPATGAATANRPDIPDGTRYSSVGVFANDTLTVIPDRLTVRGGIRYGRYVFATVAQPAFGVSEERVPMDAFTFNAGAVYALARAVNLTLNVGRGFRAPNSADFGSVGLTGGGGFEIAPSRAADLGGVVGSSGTSSAVSTGAAVPSLGPEVVYSFEPGIKFRSNRVTASLSVYDVEYLDAIERRAIVFPSGVVGTTISGFDVVRQDANGLAYIAQDIRPIATRVNGGRARMRGLDAEGTVEISRDWSARAYFAMTNGRLLATGEYLRRMPPPLGGASLRWTGARLWIEGTTAFAAAQTRFNPGDLTDARIGGTRTRASIQGFFTGTATDMGLVSNGILLATGETLSQVQARVLGTATSAPLFDRAPGFVTFGARAGVTLSQYLDVTVIGENLTDRNYRLYGSGVDAPGFNLQLRTRVRF